MKIRTVQDWMERAPSQTTQKKYWEALMYWTDMHCHYPGLCSFCGVELEYWRDPGGTSSWCCDAHSAEG